MIFKVKLEGTTISIPLLMVREQAVKSALTVKGPAMMAALVASGAAGDHELPFQVVED